MTERIVLYGRLVGAQVRSQMQYRVSFVFQLLAAMSITVVEFGSVVLVLWRFGDIGGWRLGEIALLYGIVTASFRVMNMIFAGFDPDAFGAEIRVGGLDRLMLRPAGMTLQVLGSRFEFHRVGAAVEGVLIFALGVALSDVDWTLARAAFVPAVVLGQIAFFGGLFIIGSTVTFWTVDSIEAVNILTYGGSEMISYPMHIYQDWMRRFFTFVVPAIFLNYYPVLWLLERPDPLGMPPVAPFLAPVVGIVILLLALAFWSFGLRHYQSTGT